MSIEKRHFIVRGALLEKALELKALNDAARKVHREWAVSMCGEGAEPAYQGTKCVGVIGGREPYGWRRIGAIGSKHIQKPKAKGETAKAYKDLDALPRGAEIEGALKGAFPLGPVLGEAPGRGLGIAFYHTVAAIYTQTDGEQVLLVHVPCNSSGERFPAPPDCTELLAWEWEKWLHDEKEAEAAKAVQS